MNGVVYEGSSLITGEGEAVEFFRLSGNKVNRFMEKTKGRSAMINGGFFILSPQIIDYIEDDRMLWERAPLERLAEEGEITAFHYYDFWQPMDTLRDKLYLEELWQSGNAPWKTWK